MWGECCSHRPIINTGMRQDLDENEMRITGGDVVSLQNKRDEKQYVHGCALMRVLRQHTHGALT